MLLFIKSLWEDFKWRIKSFFGNVKDLHIIQEYPEKPDFLIYFSYFLQVLKWFSKSSFEIWSSQTPHFFVPKIPKFFSVDDFSNLDWSIPFSDPKVRLKYSIFLLHKTLIIEKGHRKQLKRGGQDPKMGEGRGGKN